LRALRVATSRKRNDPDKLKKKEKKRPRKEKICRSYSSVNEAISLPLKRKGRGGGRKKATTDKHGGPGKLKESTILGRENKGCKCPLLGHIKSAPRRH